MLEHSVNEPSDSSFMPRDSEDSAAAGRKKREIASGRAADLDNQEAAQFADLIRRIRAGEQEAAAELVRRYEPVIRSVVRVHLRDPRLRRVLDSTDVCQSVLATFFVRANLGQYDLDTPQNLVKLLATIARHKVTNQSHKHQADRRDYRRDQILGDKEALLRSPGSGPDEQAASRELLAKVWEHLSEDERVLAEGRGRGDSWAELAAAHGGSPESLRKKLTRALDRVLHQLGLDENGNE
jgi:RNA polymerase sigma-70 factor (ECF subfamily)